MGNFLPCPLAPLLEPESLQFGEGPDEPRRMLARVSFADDRTGAFYVALLEESEGGDRLIVTDLVHGHCVGEYTRGSGVDDGCTYVDESSEDFRSIRVFWGQGRALECSLLRRPSVA